MTMVINLTAGDRVEMPTGGVATFVARTDHPLYAGFQLVIWRMPAEAGIDWSHDALSPVQYVGEVIPATPEDREQALRSALLGGGQ